MSKHREFLEECRQNMAKMAADAQFAKQSWDWLLAAVAHRYPMNFSWLGRPMIQVPQDTYALQELVWNVRPDLIIETGIAHGGSLIVSASLLAMLDYCDAAERPDEPLYPGHSKRKVLGIDIDIRPHNREAIEAHPLAHLIQMIEGSSVDAGVIEEVARIAKGYGKVMLCLDSNHTHAHVLAELEAYAPLTSVGSYCIVWDTGIEDLPEELCFGRPWGKGNNPKTAAREYLRRLAEQTVLAADGARLRMTVDKEIENKIKITAGPDGFLQRVA